MQKKKKIVGWSAWRRHPCPLRCLNRCEIVSRCAEYQLAHTLNLTFFDGSFIKNSAIFFFFSWQNAATENLRRRENGREEAKKPPPQNEGGLWDDNKRRDQREAAVAGLAGNGGREEGKERRVVGMRRGWRILPSLLSHPPTTKSHQWLSERGSV